METNERDDLATPAQIEAATQVAKGTRRAQRSVEFLVADADDSLTSVTKDAYRNRKRTGVDFDDLLQEARVAAVCAARTWDPERHPSWTAYAAAAAKNALSNTLNGDDSGRSLNRAAGRLLRHARGVRATAEAQGRQLGVNELIEAVRATSMERAAERGIEDPEAALRRSGELAALDKDLPYLLAEGPAVRLDAPLSSSEPGSTSIADIIDVTAGEDAPDVLFELLELCDPDDVAAVTGGGSRGSAARKRILATMTAPHAQWAAWA